EAVIRMKSEAEVPAISDTPSMPKNVVLDWFVKKAMARDPQDRFQSAREMLEHWWNVMASMDEEGATDVMRGIGRVDESYATPLHRGMHPKLHDDDITLRRSSASAPVPSSDRTLDAPPLTERMPPRAAEDHDDMPTRSDPNLRKIVERELELHRKRKGPAR